MTGNVGWGMPDLVFDANFSRIFPILGLPRDLYLPLWCLSNYVKLYFAGATHFFAGEWHHSNVCWFLLASFPGVFTLSTSIDHRPGSIADGEERSHTDLRWLHRMPCVAGCSLATKLNGGVEVEEKELKERCVSSIFFSFLFFDISMSKISPFGYLPKAPGERDGFSISPMVCTPRLDPESQSRFPNGLRCVQPLGPLGQNVTDQTAKRSSQHVGVFENEVLTP